MYAKLFSREVLMSSLTQYQPIENRGVFFMLIAAADKQGYVLGDDEAIARIINVPMDIFSKALDAMMAPDPKSKSKEYDGRRIIRLEDSPGLLIINYEKYSGIASDEQRRDYFRVKKAESRARAKAAALSPPKEPATKFTRPTREELNLEAEKIGLPTSEVDKFMNHFESNGWKVGGKAPMKSWSHSLASWKSRWSENGKTKPPESNQIAETIHVKRL